MFYFSSFLQVFRVTKEMRVGLSRCLAALTLLAHVNPPPFPTHSSIPYNMFSPESVLCTQPYQKVPCCVSALWLRSPPHIRRSLLWNLTFISDKELASFCPSLLLSLHIVISFLEIYFYFTLS